MNQSALLVQLDGKLPNIALMRLSAYLKQHGHDVEFRRWVRAEMIQSDLFRANVFDAVFASAIFQKSRPLIDQLLTQFPCSIVGGTGTDNIAFRLEDIGVETTAQDYSLYPEYPHSIGFSQRGCRLKCHFCVVPRKEGGIQSADSITAIWRGAPHPRQLVLLDNDFFGDDKWREKVDTIKAGKFQVSFCQGINARFLTPESAAALASVSYWDTTFRRRCLYTAWDNRKDEDRLFRGLRYLVEAGVSPRHIMVYMLVGYWPGETDDDREYRRAKLRAFGCDPYPMPFQRTRELIGYQRWVVGAYDKQIPWRDWVASGYYPSKLHLLNTPLLDELGDQ